MSKGNIGNQGKNEIHPHVRPADDKENEKEATKMYQPRDGDIVLFPSTLFHKTIPVEQKVDRCVIAFDLIPG